MNRYEEFLSRLLKGEKILFDGGTGPEHIRYLKENLSLN